MSFTPTQPRPAQGMYCSTCSHFQVIESVDFCSLFFPTLSSCQTKLSHICSLHSFEDAEMGLANQPAVVRESQHLSQGTSLTTDYTILSASLSPSLIRLAHHGYLTRLSLWFKLLFSLSWNPLSLSVLSSFSSLYLSLCSAMSDRLPISESQDCHTHAPVGRLILLISLKPFLSLLGRESQRGLAALSAVGCLRSRSKL